jgi:MFS transporter, DHA1 family, staphyloferrin A biosynthesis exporter
MKLFGNLRTFESLGLRDYRLLWLGQLTTTLGQWMDQTARSWLIYTLTGSAWQLGLVSAVRGIPLLLFGVVAGVAADRYGKKVQIIIAQVVNALLNLVLATLILTHHVEVWQVYVTGFLSGTVQAFQQPARQVLINELAGPKNLLNAIALSSAAFNASRSIGPAFCGLLIQYSGVDIAYYVQAALYAFATVWTFQMQVPASHPSDASRPQPEQSIFASAREGFAFIVANKLILALMVLGLAPLILGVPYISLMPLFALDVLHGTATTQGWLLTMTGVGAVIGALTIASLGRRQGNGQLLVLAACGFGLALLLFARSPVLWMALLFTFFAGLANAGYTSQDQTIIQVLTPAQLRGRVLGIYFLNRGLMPVGSLIAGGLAALWGGPWAVTIMGASCLAVAIGVAVLYPAIWKLRTIQESTPDNPSS